MSREWNPGDVAMGTVNGTRVQMVRTTNPGEWALAEKVAKGNDYASGFANARDSITDPRPLVVIDPEDREQVERLMVAVMGKMSIHFGELPKMQAALREFANPTPTIEEPMGLGAVVEDDSGERWVRLHLGTLAPWRGTQRPDENRPLRYFKDIAVVRVLSEGIS